MYRAEKDIHGQNPTTYIFYPLYHTIFLPSLQVQLPFFYRLKSRITETGADPGSQPRPGAVCSEKTDFGRVSIKQLMERICTDTLRFLYPYIRLQAALALPLGELSPQVTERVVQPVLNGNVNLFAHTMKIPVDIPVGESQNLQTKSRQELRTLSVIWYGHILPSPSSLCSATSPKGRGKGCSHDTPKGA